MGKRSKNKQNGQTTRPPVNQNAQTIITPRPPGNKQNQNVQNQNRQGPSTVKTPKTQMPRVKFNKWTSHLGTTSSKVPLEVFTQILYYALNTHPFGQDENPEYTRPFRPWAPVSLARVCKAWKDIVFSTPLLWTHWNLYVGSNIGQLKGMLRIAKKHAKLSRKLPLTVQLAFNWEAKFGFSSYDSEESDVPEDDDATDPLEGQTLLARFLHKHCSRFQHFNVVGPGCALQDLGEAARAADLSFGMPQLQTFEVIDFDPTPSDHGDYAEQPDCPLRLKPGSSLTGLLLDRVTHADKFKFRSKSAFKNITTLCLRQPGRDLALYVLSLCPRVERVELLCVWEWTSKDAIPEKFRQSLRDGKQISLPDLRILDFSTEDRDMNNEALKSMFSPLEMPKLTHLRWVLFRDWNSSFNKTQRDQEEHSAARKRAHLKLVGKLVARCATTLRTLVFGHHYAHENVLEKLHAKAGSDRSQLRVIGYEAPGTPHYDGDYPTQALIDFADWPFAQFKGPRDMRTDFYQEADCIIE